MADAKLSPIQLYAIGALAAGAFPNASEQCIGNHSEDSNNIFLNFINANTNELTDHQDGGLYLSEDCDTDAIKIRRSFLYTGTREYSDAQNMEKDNQKKILNNAKGSSAAEIAKIKEENPIRSKPGKLRSLNLPIMLEIMNKLQGGGDMFSMCLDDNRITKSEWGSPAWLNKIYFLYEKKFKRDVRTLLRQRDLQSYEYEYLEYLRNSELIDENSASNQLQALPQSGINTAKFKDGTWDDTSNVNSAAWMFCLKNRYSYTNAPEWSPKGASIVFTRPNDNEIQYDFSNLARQQLVINDNYKNDSGKWKNWYITMKNAHLKLIKDEKSDDDATRKAKSDAKKLKKDAVKELESMITDLRDTTDKDPEEEKLLGYLLESNYPRKCWLTGYPIFNYDAYFTNGLGKQEAEHVLPFGMARTLLAIVSTRPFNNALQDPFTTTDLEHEQGVALGSNRKWWRGKTITARGRAPGVLWKIQTALGGGNLDAGGGGIVHREIERHTAPLESGNQDEFNLLLREKIAAEMKPSTKLGNQIKSDVPFINLIKRQYQIDFEVCSKFLLITGLCMFEFNYKDILLFGEDEDFNNALDSFKAPVLDIGDLNEVIRVIGKAEKANVVQDPNKTSSEQYANASYKLAYRDFKMGGVTLTSSIIKTIENNWPAKKEMTLTLNVEIPWLINHLDRKILIEEKIRRENRSIFFGPQ